MDALRLFGYQLYFTPFPAIMKEIFCVLEGFFQLFFAQPPGCLDKTAYKMEYVRHPEPHPEHKVG